MVPDYFWEIPDAVLLEVWNGIGAEGEWANIFIPETVWFLNISLASLPHDIEFHIGKSMYDFNMANLRFLFNMNRIVEIESMTGMVTIRELRTNKYYLATCSEKGEQAFWKGKTRPTNIVDNNGYEIITEFI
jgi:hypothetical protein